MRTITQYYIEALDLWSWLSSGPDRHKSGFISKTGRMYISDTDCPLCLYRYSIYKYDCDGCILDNAFGCAGGLFHKWLKVEGFKKQELAQKIYRMMVENI